MFFIKEIQLSFYLFILDMLRQAYFLILLVTFAIHEGMATMTNYHGERLVVCLKNFFSIN